MLEGGFKEKNADHIHFEDDLDFTGFQYLMELYQGKSIDSFYEEVKRKDMGDIIVDVAVRYQVESTDTFQGLAWKLFLRCKDRLEAEELQLVQLL
jgi:hypothetical protein